MTPVDLRGWLCTRRNVRSDHTRDVIAEAQATRSDLVRLTGRLDQYVTDLQARIRLELRRQIEGKAPGG